MKINVNWLGFLGVILVVFKILGAGVVATWSWWLVLLPFYVGLLIVVGLLLGGLLLAGIASILALFVAYCIDLYDSWKRWLLKRR